MDAKTFERTLRAFARRTPFRPFVVELISGTSLLIEHPEALIFRGLVAIHVDKENEMTIFDNEGVSKITTKRNSAAAK